jgi:hypothetical protein
MQLLIRRGQRRGLGGKPVFDLWVQFELTLEEQGLIHKYGIQKFVLSHGNVKLDIIKAVIYAWLLSLIVFIIASISIGIGDGMRLSFLMLTIGSFVIYHHIRETIKVKDILTGRSFACSSVLALIEKEENLKMIANAFRRLLEAMKTWGGKEVITLSADQEPTFRIIEPHHDNAA